MCIECVTAFLCCQTALNGLQLLYDVFLSLFGNTGLTHLDVAGGRMSSTGTPSASAEASIPRVRRVPVPPGLLLPY